jgi:hypothetical protein
MSLAKVRKILTSKGISFREGEEFSEGQKGSIWSWAEGEHPDYFNYYSEDYKNFDMGVNKKLMKELAKVGYYAEWYDCGTIFIYEI